MTNVEYEKQVEKMDKAIRKAMVSYATLNNYETEQDIPNYIARAAVKCSINVVKSFAKELGTCGITFTGGGQSSCVITASTVNNLVKEYEDTFKKATVKKPVEKEEKTN